MVHGVPGERERESFYSRGKPSTGQDQTEVSGGTENVGRVSVCSFCLLELVFLSWSVQCFVFAHERVHGRACVSPVRDLRGENRMADQGTGIVMAITVTNVMT